MEMKKDSFTSNTPRNKILLGSTAINGSIAFEDEFVLENIKPELYSETTYTPFVAIERENIYGSKKLLKTNLLPKENKPSAG